jgi:hypothetical protein
LALWSTPRIRASRGKRQPRILPELRHHRQPPLSAPWPSLVMTKLTVTTTAHPLASLPTLLHQALAGLLDNTERWTALHLPTVAMLAPVGTSPSPPGLRRWRSLRCGLAGLLPGCGHDGLRRAALDPEQGYTPQPPSWHCLARQRRKNPLSARGRRARFGPDALITPPHDALIGVQQRRAQQEPWQVPPVQPRRAEALERAVPAAFAGPARQTAPGPTTASCQHGLDRPPQLAPWGGLETGA